MSVGAVNKETGDRIPTAGNPLDKVGNLASLHTTAKNDAVSAINEVKDEQANKADNDIVADAFSAAETYAKGDYCTYEGGLYKFKTSHSGAWDAADVDQIQIAGELSELKNTLTAKYVAFNPASGVITELKTTYKCSNILFSTLWIGVPSTLISASSELGSFDVTLVNQFRTIGVATGPSTIKEKIGHFIITSSGKLLVDNNYALPGAGEYKLDITVPLSS